MPTTCPDCHGELEKGIILDSSHGAILVQRWAKGSIPEEKRSIIWGSLETQFNDVRRVVSYRCAKCNRLFEYAQNTIQFSNLNARMRNMWLAISGIIITALLFLFLLISLLK